MQRRKKPQDGTPYREIIVKFATKCVKCAVSVPARSKSFYDTGLKRVVCGSCVRKLKKGLEPQPPLSPAQASIVRLEKMLSGGGPTAEERADFEQLVNSLKVQYAAERIAQSFLADLYQVPQNASYISMSIRHDDKCHGCAEQLNSGSVAVWDKDAHRIWCLNCAGDL
jgi:hypothetical protein